MTDRFVEELEHIIKFEDEFSDQVNNSMAKPDINGIDLSFYHVYKYVSKVDRTFRYVIENPDGNPFHDEFTLEGWYFYLDILRMSIKCNTNLIDMALERQPKEEKEDTDSVDGRMVPSQSLVRGRRPDSGLRRS